MARGKLSMRNGCAIIILLHISLTVILGFPAGGGPGSWISFLMALVAIVPLMALYARLVHLMPGKNFFEMMDFAFGKVATSIISGFYAAYFLILTSVTRGNYAEFVRLTTLPHTSFIIICLVFFIAVSYLAYSGAETLGKWCSIMLALSILAIILLIAFSASRIRMDNLLPLFEAEFRTMAVTGLRLLPLPIGETIAVLCLADSLDESVNPYKMFILSSICSIIIFVLLFLQSCGILGTEMLDNAYFPPYKSASVIHLGSIGTRIESMAAFIFMLAALSKMALSLIAASKAAATVVRLQSHRAILVPVGFFSVALSVIQFANIEEMFDSINLYMVYAPAFQMLVPIILWITAEIRLRRQNIPIGQCWQQKENTPPSPPEPDPGLNLGGAG